MHTIALIIQREYLSRVRKKSFLVTTLLVPLLFSGLMAAIVWLTLRSEEAQRIAVVDDSGLFASSLDSGSKAYTFLQVKGQSNETPAQTLERSGADILLRIFPFREGKPDSILLYKKGGVSLAVKDYIGNRLDESYRKWQMEQAGIDEKQIDQINESSLSLRSYDLENNKETHSEVASMIGYFMGFLIYIVIFIYGAGVMRGVMEEKTSRIAEVIVSSVKPFHLMMGKIIGIGLVGLTQFGLWLFCGFLLQGLLPFFMPDMTSGAAMMPGANPEMMAEATDTGKMALFQALAEQNWGLIFGSFLFYFLGGYLLYAALFAAVGSLVNEDPQEAQQLTLPITMPIIFGFVIMATSVKDPNSGLSVFGSLFPLTSPIVMLARIPYGVPVWQLLLSMGLLVGGFLFFTWLSARIYRTGILLYGKKVTWKEVWKWLRYS
jgi:ABC-2 type transport system permease protein